MRTSLSLDSFGFTIYKLLQSFTESGADLPGEGTRRSIGLFLTAMGTVAMVMGAVEYPGVLRELREVGHFRLARPSLIMAVLMSVMSVFMFFSIISKLF